MTDLSRILPSFPIADFSALQPAIEHHALTTTDLLALHPVDIAKQTRIPLLDLKRFIAAIQTALVDDLTPESLLPAPPPAAENPDSAAGAPASEASTSAATRPSATSTDAYISTLDDELDAALGGGVPVGRITEFAGESGAGKTQFLLSLCLAVQLPPPHGLGRQALYVSTESSLATSRLSQMLAGHPLLQESTGDGGHRRPSLDHIHSTLTSDLESQEHVLEFQVPVLLARYPIGLIVIDSVAANFRAEFERQAAAARSSNMAARSADLVRLGAHLRDLARRHNLAVVVANQVADRFPSSSSSSSSYIPPPSSSSPALRRSQQPRYVASTQETPLASRSRPPQASMPSGTPDSPLPFALPPEDTGPPVPPALHLDHQQRWFTGWGDEMYSSYALKTPSLGLVWTTQIACRVALFRRPVYGRPRHVAPPVSANDDDYDPDTAAPTLRAWRRWMKVVFAPHVEASGPGVVDAVEFEITSGGLKAVKAATKSKKSQS